MQWRRNSIFAIFATIVVMIFAPGCTNGPKPTTTKLVTTATKVADLKIGQSGWLENSDFGAVGTSGCALSPSGDVQPNKLDIFIAHLEDGYFASFPKDPSNPFQWRTGEWFESSKAPKHPIAVRNCHNLSQPQNTLLATDNGLDPRYKQFEIRDMKVGQYATADSEALSVDTARRCWLSVTFNAEPGKLDSLDQADDSGEAFYDNLILSRRSDGFYVAHFYEDTISRPGDDPGPTLWTLTPLSQVDQATSVGIQNCAGVDQTPDDFTKTANGPFPSDLIAS